MNIQSTKKGIAALVAFLIIFGVFISPIKSYAHENYFFQVLIDENQYTYQGNVLADEADWLSNEEGHMEAQFGDFTPLIKDNYTAIPQKGEKVKETKVVGQQALPFSFSPEEKGDGWFDNTPVNNATKDDVNRAYFVKDTLVTGLNDALRILNKNKPFEDMGELLTKSNELGNAIRQVSNGSTASIDGFTFRQGRASFNKDPDLNKKTGIESKDYVTISQTKNGETLEYEFVYRVVKGYTEKGNWDNKVYNEAYKNPNDTKYITWNMIMYQGVYAYSAKGMTSKNGGEVAKPGQLEEMVAWMFESLYNGIRNLLGLYDLNELIFNDGIRGSAAWHYGAMPMNWEENVTLYHWIFQLIAWTVIGFSIAKLLITRNISTINPSMRVSLISGVQDLMITGMILAFTMPIINVLLNINAKIVDIFAAVGPDLDSVMGVNNYSNMLAGIIIQFFFLFIMIYMNFTYIIRSITIAILTAMAPLFVVTLSLGAKWKGLFSQWMKELTSNIFLQSFHSFILSFLFISTTSSRGIEAIVICFALIPLTEFFRGMIMGQAGGIASRMGMGSVVAGAGLAMGAAQKGTSMGQKRVQNSNGQSGSPSSLNGGSTSEGSNAMSQMNMNDLKLGSSDNLRNKAEAGVTQSRTKHQDLRNAQLQKQVPPEIISKGMDSQEYKEYMGAPILSEAQAKYADLKDNFKADLQSGIQNAVSGTGLKNMAMGTGKTLLGASAMMAGAGFAMAFGGENAGAVAMGSRVAGMGGRTAYQTAKAGITKVAPSVGQAALIAGSVGAGFVAAKMGSANSGSNSASATNLLNHQRAGKMGQGQSDVPLSQGTTESHTTPETSSAENLGSAHAANYRTLTENIGQRSIGNDGDFQVYRDGAALRAQGILKASENSNGTSVYSYDTSKLSDGDRNNIQTYANTFSGNNQDQITQLRKSGVEGAWKNQDGSIGVAYNQMGKEKLGIQRVDTVGGNIVETKRSNQPESTRVSFQVPLQHSANASTGASKGREGFSISGGEINNSSIVNKSGGVSISGGEVNNSSIRNKSGGVSISGGEINNSSIRNTSGGISIHGGAINNSSVANTSPSGASNHSRSMMDEINQKIRSGDVMVNNDVIIMGGTLKNNIIK
ncbi:hypothetical protein [Paenibacillus polymyxa]|uniref:Uncharacterized protein n=1 Tax=Paenibacillus polymyxa (strain SC2) TaxID=886882 RepID=E3EKV5_PAEPS|nr:hypothetical protein [Paenibacillus polymyxa]ADO59556.1 hypothetical protein PPSC2_27315 [Paenibacillus polymyxa SC2]WPQ59612.1 hypothetical protein SKN87_28540 [Paenibacillus polymyxa]